MRIAIRPLLAMIALTAVPVATTNAAQSTAEVAVSITVVPFAEVALDADSVIVTLPAAGGVFDPVYVGGTVTSNCSVTLSADIQKPAGAPGTWSVTAGAVGEPGFNQIGQLVEINVTDIDSGPGGDLPLELFGSKLGESPTVGAGQVVVTVMQN